MLCSTRSSPIASLEAADDPYCREAFPRDEADWDQDLPAFYREATALRHRHEVLRTGRFESLHAEDRMYAFRRRLKDQEAVVAFNAGTSAARLELSASDVRSSSFQPVWPPEAGDDEGVRMDDAPSTVTIPGREARVWVTAD